MKLLTYYVSSMKEPCPYFLDKNMDGPYAVEWEDMTASEQFEWRQTWRSLQQDWQRHEVETRGLVGTNPDRIATEAELRTVLVNVVSLTKKRRRDFFPPHHALADRLRVVVRQLFPGDFDDDVPPAATAAS